MKRRILLLLTAAWLLAPAGCDNAGFTTVTIRVREGLNTRAHPMPVDASQLGPEHFTEEVSRSGDFKVRQEIGTDRPVKIVLVPLTPQEAAARRQ